MTDVIKEEVDINETFDSTRKMVHGEPLKGTIAYGRKYGPYTAKGYPRKRPNPNKPPEQVAEVLTKSMGAGGAGEWIKDFVKSKNPKFAGKSKEKLKEMALGAFYSKEEVSFDESNDWKQGFLDDYNVLRGHKNPEVKKHLTAAEINFKNKNFQNAHSYMQKAKNAARTSKQANEEVEQIDELSPALLNRAASAAKGQANWAHGVASRVPSNPGYKNLAGRRDALVKKAATKLGKNTLEIRPDSFDTDRRGVGSKNPIVKPSHNEQLAPSGESLDEGRGRPPKPGSAAWKKRQSEGGGEGDRKGLEAHLIDTQSHRTDHPPFHFANGEKVQLSRDHSNKAREHINAMKGPGKDPQARDDAINAMSKSHDGLMQAIGVKSKPEGTKNPMSAQKAPPKLSLTQEESNMSQEDIVEKLQAALDAGILSQNDFDKLTQIDEDAPMYNVRNSSGTIVGTHSHTGGFKPSRPESGLQPGKTIPQGHTIDRSSPVRSSPVREDSEQIAESPSHLGYSGHVDGKEYTMTIPNKGDGLGNYSDASLHKLLKKQNPHLEDHHIKAIVNSGGDEDSEQPVEHKGMKYTHRVVNYQEPRHLYNEVIYTGNPIDEKALSRKQKDIAALDGDPNNIDAKDLKKLRKEETTAGVAAVVAALSRNLKELK